MSAISKVSVSVVAGALLVSLWGCGAAPKAAPEAPAPAPNAQPAGLQPAKAGAVDIRRNPTDLPAPITRKAPEKVVVNLETTEVEGKLEDGSTYTYWTFNNKLPGPMVRVRVGDTVELHLKNNAQSKNVHSIDLHAVNGPGGGAVATQVKPGEEKMFSFKALNPGVYVYHCASSHIPTHIAQGMYGLIVVEPEGGLAKVDREFYMMQAELYTSAVPGTKGHHEFNGTAMVDERPSFVVFNGAFQALASDMAMKAKAGETVRIFVGNGGPNLISSFHVIGEIFDTLHREGGAETDHHVQTTLIPSGGASWVEFRAEVPGTYLLVDHSISRAINKGAVGALVVEGQENPDVFNGKVEAGSGH